MRSDPADRLRRAALPPRPGGPDRLPSRDHLIRRLLGIILVGALVAGCGGEVSIAPPKPPADVTAPHAQQAQESLDRLVSALESGTRQDAVALAAPDADSLLGHVHDNAQALRIDQLSMRYVDEGTPLTEGDQADLPLDAWRGTVELEFAYGGIDQSPARLETSVVFAPTTSEVLVAGFGGGDLRSPMWLLDQLSVVRTRRSLLVVSGASAGRYPGLVTGALRQVGRVLPRWKGSLVVEVPGSSEQLEAAIDAPEGQYDAIAAVTTTADGALASGAPVRVLVNPEVYTKLRPRGAQVVMSHEAAHVATDAPFTSMPTWLLEGFADYVALDGAGVPVTVAARQVLDQIRKDGLPRRLPTSEDLSPSAEGLGATYEEAWLACRFFGREYGTDRLVRFYRKVSAGASAEEAFRVVLGMSQRGFVARWRTDLARLADMTG